jgi:phage tail-like protein
VTAATPPLNVFRFQLRFHDPSVSSPDVDVNICDGAFSECTGLEGTMEPKVIKEGGRNYGAVQRAGLVTFATVVLKRGISTNLALYQWFSKVSQGQYGYRLTVQITLLDVQGNPVTTWQLENALPIKLKIADFNAKATDVGIEELHLAHEGLTLSS